MIILDTNVLSELIKPQGSTLVRNWAAGQPVTSLFTTTITQAEILYGIAILPEGKRKYELYQAATLMFAEDFVGRVLPFGDKYLKNQINCTLYHSYFLRQISSVVYGYNTTLEANST